MERACEHGHGHRHQHRLSSPEKERVITVPRVISPFVHFAHVKNFWTDCKESCFYYFIFIIIIFSLSRVFGTHAEKKRSFLARSTGHVCARSLVCDTQKAQFLS
jgi:hypothetical protein